MDKITDYKNLLVYDDYFPSELRNSIPLQPDTIYFVNNKERDMQGAWFLCPCGCEQHTYVHNHEWEFELHDDNSITISPSLLQMNGCKSHFFIRHNKVVWC